MLDVCLLGTGGMMPLPYRWLTSLLLRYQGKEILIDCGEGTQIALREAKFSPKPIDIMCFTHYHADHISGLPGMLLTMGNAERTEPLLMIGPKGLARVAGALRCIAPELPFEIQYREIEGDEESILFDGFRINAFKASHNVLCYGYSLEIDRIGKFLPEKAKELGIPLQCWNLLQKGQEIRIGERTFTPDMVLGPPRKGIKLTYCTDSRPTDRIVEHARKSDLFICEGMYGEADKLQKAKEHKHMTMYEAAEMAKRAEVSQLWLTHYSPSLNHPEEFMPEVRRIFPEAVAARDGRGTVLTFDEKE